MIQKIQVQTEYGNAEVESVKISELGYVQLRLYHPDRSQWITYTVRDGINKLIKDLNIELING